MSELCYCRQCRTERQEIRTVSLTGHDLTTLPLGAGQFVGMITCETCGNKRCPHATDHRHACTDSNASRQLGSLCYPIYSSKRIRGVF